MSRTTLTPKTCGLLLIETTKDSSARYFPLSQTIGDEYVSLFAMSRTIADSSGRYHLLSRTIADEYVFHFSMFNRLSDRYPCRGVLNTPHIDSTSTHSPFAGHLVGRMQYAPTLPAEKSDLKGWRGVMFGAKGEESVFNSIMSNRLLDRYPGRGAKAYAPCAFIVYPHALCRAFGGAYAICSYPAGRKMRIPWVGITYCLGQSETNTYLIPSCPIDY